MIGVGAKVYYDLMYLGWIGPDVAAFAFYVQPDIDGGGEGWAEEFQGFFYDQFDLKMKDTYLR